MLSIGKTALCRSSFGKITILGALCSVVSGISAAQSLVSAPPAQNFGQVPVNGSTPTTMALGYALSGSSPVFSLAYNTDFTIAPAKCVTSGSITCTVSVTFSPAAPGLRQNAVLVKDTSGNLLTATLLYGVGQGPQTIFFPGTISTVAGTGAWNYSGDGKTASIATFRNPQGLAVDNSGNLYIADSVNQVIREVSAATGKISTVVGSGAAGYGGDSGPALRAVLNTPTSVALDGAGNLYVVDEGNNLVRKINAVTQQITTVAGGGSAPSGKDGLGDGGLATNALLNGPSDIALDGIGNLYIADSYNNVIRRVDVVTGIISVVAGGGNNSGTDGFGDGGLAINARLNDPMGLGLDALGNLYIADSGDSLVRRVDVGTGVITAVAGSGRSGYSGDLGMALNASLGSPSAVRIDAAGNIYIADQGKNVVRVVSAASGIITTFAGTGVAKYFGDGGAPTSAGLANPYGLALDPKGNLYIADFTNNAIRKITLTGSQLNFPTTLVGQSSGTQVITVFNDGNQAFTFSSLSVPTGFVQQAFGSDCSPSTVLASGATCTIALQFVPAGTGVVSGSLSITTTPANGSGLAQSFLLSGTGATGAVPVVSLTSTSLNFGNQTVGTTSAAQSFALTNTGAAPLQIRAIGLGGMNSSDFGVTTTCQTVVTAGANCTVSVTFTPAAAASRVGSITLFDNAGSSSQTVALSGTGTGTPQATFSGTTLQFGSQSIGGTAAVKNVTLSNTGSGPLSISTISLAGTNGVDFSLSNTCGNTLVAGASCQLSISFAPRGPGLRIGTLTFTSNASPSTQTVTLQGTGSIKTTPTVWRPSNGTWYLENGNSPAITISWGLPGDVPVRGDYDGDGQLDTAVYRPSNSVWYVICSSTGAVTTRQWGIYGDIPVPGDYDGDGKADIAVYRPSNNSWYIIPSKTGIPYQLSWGIRGDVPVAGDYDGDGKVDLAVFRPSTCVWYILQSNNGAQLSYQWGIAGDTPVPGDYDGDSKTDFAVYRPSNKTWFIVPSSTNQAYSFSWGLAGDIPVPGDYDGDGKVDAAVWRPSNGSWYILPSKTQSSLAIQFGLTGDYPVTPCPN